MQPPCLRLHTGVPRGVPVQQRLQRWSLGVVSVAVPKFVRRAQHSLPRHWPGKPLADPPPQSRGSKATKRKTQSGPAFRGASPKAQTPKPSQKPSEQDEFLDAQAKIPIEVSPPPPFDELGESWNGAELEAELLDALLQEGFVRPSASQRWAVPLLLAGKDVMVCSQTGSGKTLAYLVPLLQLLAGRPQTRARVPCPGAVVIAPTRELASQIATEAVTLCRAGNIQVACIFGGQEELRRGADLLVCTPGRLEDACQRGDVQLRGVQVAVLDEADRLLDLGFEDQIRLLLTKRMPKTGEGRQTAMFSATFGTGVQHLAADFLDAYTFVAVGRVGSAAKTVEQRLLWVEEDRKPKALLGTLLGLEDGEDRSSGPLSAVVFVNTKDAARLVEQKVRAWKFRCFSIHGEKKQTAREEALRLFRAHVEGRASKRTCLAVLVATDVAARGLDIPNISCVIHYDLPRRIDDYVHRSGRTGRFGRRGLSVGFAHGAQRGLSVELVKHLAEAGTRAPPWLLGMAIAGGTSLEDLQPFMAQTASYGAQDVRLGSGPGLQTAAERREAQKLRSFAQDAYGAEKNLWQLLRKK